jgi:hypothetical protein
MKAMWYHYPQRGIRDDEQKSLGVSQEKENCPHELCRWHEAGCNQTEGLISVNATKPIQIMRLSGLI